jgi:hypothetical protein
MKLSLGSVVDYLLLSPLVGRRAWIFLNWPLTPDPCIMGLNSNLGERRDTCGKNY